MRNLDSVTGLILLSGVLRLHNLSVSSPKLRTLPLALSHGLTLALARRLLDLLTVGVVRHLRLHFFLLEVGLFVTHKNFPHLNQVLLEVRVAVRNAIGEGHRGTTGLLWELIGER